MQELKAGDYCIFSVGKNIAFLLFYINVDLFMGKGRHRREELPSSHYPRIISVGENIAFLHFVSVISLCGEKEG